MGRPRKPKRLPKPADRLLQSFADLANKEVLHPLDWKRFYEFIQYCHRHHIKARDFEIARILITLGFSDEYSNDLGIVYQHGRGVLKTPYPDRRYVNHDT